MTAAGVLTEPTEAARQLLNLSSDEKLVSVKRILSRRIKQKLV